MPIVCGNGIVQGLEECDCGMNGEICDDPCCYPAEISEQDLSLNSSAISCKLNQSPVCLNPFHSIIYYGLVAPLVFIVFIWVHKYRT